MINSIRFKDLAISTILLWGLAVLSTASLVGCAANSPTLSANQESFTDSDEPETRKRAVNRLRLAVLYFTDGKLSIALDEVKQAISADPNWFESYNMRGLIYMQMSDFPLASSSFQKALSLNAGSAEVKHNYAVLLCKNGRSAEAVKFFNGALETSGYARRSNSLTELGLCQLSVGLKFEAEAAFLRSYEIDPSNPVAGYNLAQGTFQRGEYVKAQFYVRRINNSEAATAETLWLGVKVERRLGNRDAAEQLASQLKKRFPQSSESTLLDRGAFNE